KINTNPILTLELLQHQQYLYINNVVYKFLSNLTPKPLPIKEREQKSKPLTPLATTRETPATQSLLLAD
ncbi:MAG: hypothetical protein ACRAVC_06355, partial [Trichormus sp.]